MVFYGFSEWPSIYFNLIIKDGQDLSLSDCDTAAISEFLWWNVDEAVEMWDCDICEDAGFYLFMLDVNYLNFSCTMFHNNNDHYLNRNSA